MADTTSAPAPVAASTTPAPVATTAPTPVPSTPAGKVRVTLKRSYGCCDAGTQMDFSSEQAAILKEHGFID